MRIAIDTRDLAIARTGARTYLEELCRVFPLVGTEHEFLFLAPRWQPNGRSPLHKILNHLNFYWWKEIQLPWLAWRNHCDIIFCTDYVAPLFSPCPTILVMYGANIWKTPEQYHPIWRFLLTILALPAARRAAAIVTISESAKRDLVQYTSLPAHTIRVIPIAPKLAAFQTQLSLAERQNILAKYHIPTEVPFILHIGVKEKRKNLPRLVQAFAQARQQLPTALNLVLAGQPAPVQGLDDSPQITQAIKDHGLETAVYLPTYIPDTDLPAFYQSALFYAFPSLYEGFGLPALEAFANQLPLIASNTTAIPEVTGSAALLFDPLSLDQIVQAIVTMATHETTRHHFIHKGTQQLARFSWEKTATKLLETFQEFV